MDIGELHTLYKYRSLSGGYGRSAVERAVLGSQLYWQRPTSFNDPFDCQPHLVFGSSRHDRQAYGRYLANTRMAGLPRSERRIKARSLSRTPQDRAGEIFRAVIDRAVVTCFSLGRDNPLMWAHYASNHTGICLVFQESAEPPFFSLEVEYSSHRPTIDVIHMRDQKGEAMRKIMLTKAGCWSYEQERRMFQRGEPGFVMFPGQCLTGIIMGARISEEDRAFVTGLARQRRLPLNLFQAELDPRDYRVNIQSLT